MNRLTLLAGCALAACAAVNPARAELRTIANAGLWSTYGGTDDQQRRVCGVVTVGGDGRRIDVAQYSADGGIDLSLQKDSWSIPANTGIDMQLQFDRDGAVPQHGIGDGRRVVAHMDFAQTVPFMRALRNGVQIRVFFPNGNEPVWTGGLSGSGRAIDAFNDCRASLSAGAPTQPYAASPALQQPLSSPAEPTQPFAAPASAPQRTGLPPLPAPG
jgi:hypothetical protein